MMKAPPSFNCLLPIADCQLRIPHLQSAIGNRQLAIGNRQLAMQYDILIIGGGHAGAEAAWVASRLGASVALIRTR